jgi:hypothetical protein
MALVRNWIHENLQPKRCAANWQHFLSFRSACKRYHFSRLNFQDFASAVKRGSTKVLPSIFVRFLPLVLYSARTIILESVPPVA